MVDTDIDLQEFATRTKRQSYRPNQRTKAQIEANRMRITDLRLVGYTHREIANIINAEMLEWEDADSFPLTEEMVRRDWLQVRRQWQEQEVRSFAGYIHEELQRVDLALQEAWSQYRRVTRELDRHSESETVLSEYDDAKDFVETGGERKTGRTRTTVQRRQEYVKEQQYWFSRIESLAEKRQRLLGLTGTNVPSIFIDNRKQEANINVSDGQKKYVSFSPDDWDNPALSGKQQDHDGPEIIDGIYE